MTKIYTNIRNTLKNICSLVSRVVGIFTKEDTKQNPFATGIGIYTGVASRETPASILQLMTAIAQKLESQGWVLRTDDSKGADAAFAAHVNLKQIYSVSDVLKVSPSVYQLAQTDFYDLHPNSAACNAHAQYVRHLHMRSGLGLLGTNYNEPSKFVICWAPNTQVTGSTGQTIRLANKYNIPVFNLANPEHYNRISRWLGA